MKTFLLKKIIFFTFVTSFTTSLITGFQDLDGARERDTDAQAEKSAATFSPKNTFVRGETVIVQRSTDPEWRYGIIDKEIGSKWRVLADKSAIYDMPIGTKDLLAENIGKFLPPSKKKEDVKTFTTLTGWAQACAEKPEYSIGSTTEFEPPVVEWPELLKTMEKFVTKSTTDFSDAKNWLGSKNPDHKIFENFPEETVKESTILFVQKFNIPRHPAKICFIGDIHGSIHSLLRNLLRLQKLGYLNDDFSIKDPDFYIIFNGDFVDRGRYGAEVWYTLLRLKLATWDRVFLLRGNHETFGISSGYGFAAEIKSKYSQEAAEITNEFKIVVSLYALLPLALYLGQCKAIVQDGTKKAEKNCSVQCSHGGIEVGYDPEKLLITPGKFFELLTTFDLARFKKLEAFCEGVAMWEGQVYCMLDRRQPTLYTVDKYPFEGFNWSDCTQNSTEGKIKTNMVRGAGYIADVAATYQYLNKTPLVKAFFRGHQDRSFGFKLLYGNQDLSMDEIPTEAKTNTNYPDGPFHWMYIKEQYDQINPFGFRMYNSRYTDHAPVFTSTTATEGQSVPYDFFLMLFTDEKYENWRLKPYEFKLPDDRDFKNLTGLTDTFEAWQTFITTNNTNMKAAEEKFEETLNSRIKELSAETDDLSAKVLSNARAELAWYKKQTPEETKTAPTPVLKKSGVVKAKVAVKVASKKPTAPLASALTKLVTQLGALSEQLQTEL